jgi:Tol biopolymer transport system component
MLGSAPVAAQEAGTTRTIPDASGPAWSHGGDRLALFTKGEIRSTLSVYDLATGETTPLREMRYPSGLVPLWLPDDSAILVPDFTSTDRVVAQRPDWDLNLFGVDVAGGQSKQLTSAEGMRARHPVVSPDGTLLAFEGPKLGTPFTVPSIIGGWNEKRERVEIPIQMPYTGLWLLSADGGEPTLVFPEEDAAETSPRFSPDGSHILFTRYTRFNAAEREWSRRNVGVYDVAAQQMRLLTGDDRSHSATWSPDGLSIAYTAGERGDELWLMQADGIDPRMIKGGGIVSYDPRTVTWTPDGRFVVFVSKGDIFAVPATGVGLYALTEGADISPIYGFSLHPDGKRIAFTRGPDTVVIMELDWSKVPAATP